MLGAAASGVATVFGLLPERVDVTHVFAAYGAGAIAGELFAARRSVASQRSWLGAGGGALMISVGAVWMLGLLLRLG